MMTLTLLITVYFRLPDVAQVMRGGRVAGGLHVGAGVQPRGGCARGGVRRRLHVRILLQATRQAHRHRRYGCFNITVGSDYTIQLSA